MSRNKSDEGLSTSAGLVRYMDEDASKIKIAPEKVLGITISIMVLMFVLNYGLLA
jgi:preprotein translocase subunit Sec61beta